MKVNFNLNEKKINKNVNFEGYKPVKDQHGKRQYEFNYVYDDSKYDCYLEIFALSTDRDNNFVVEDMRKNSRQRNSQDKQHGVKLHKGKNIIDIAGNFEISPDEDFAYHYKLVPKNNPDGAPKYDIDAGNVLNDSINTGYAHDIYNVVTKNVSTCTNNGPMKLIIPDINNVMWVYNDKNQIVSNPDIEKLRNTTKNFANKIGGSLAGIEKDIDDGKLDNFRKIITTPLFTDDSLTAHAYWNKNNFQMAHSLGNINNYIALQKKLFAKGINLVSDGAFVNEGLEGIHFNNVLKFGEESPYFYWFRIQGLKDSPLSLGVFGKKIEHATHRLINSPYHFVQNSNGTVSISENRKYNRKAPTYIQIYDSRIKNAENLYNEDLIKEYNVLCKKPLNTNTHNDTVIPYSFRINPETYKANVLKLNEYNKSVAGQQDKIIPLKSGKGTRAVAEFEYFGLDGKHESGFETWDANPDIAKLNYIYSSTDTTELKNITDPIEREDKLYKLQRSNMQVQDYAITSAKYWTRKTRDILRLNVAQHLKNIDNLSAEEIYQKIHNLSDGKIFPKDLDVTKDIVSNVLKDRYELKGASSPLVFKNRILKDLMDVPLDSIEVGDDIAAVLASPYISKRATNEEDIGISRFDQYYYNEYTSADEEYEEVYALTNKMYDKELLQFAREIFFGVESKLPPDKKLQDQYGNTTLYGRYVVPLLTQEIIRFAIIKAVAPDAEFRFNRENGEISYDYKKLKNTSLLGMGIVEYTPEDEAKHLIKKLRKGIKRIGKQDKEQLATALLRSINGTNLNSFKLAEMIVDRSQAGLDWRIDATKDITDIESLRNQKDDFEYNWDSLIEFWAKFAKEIKEYHPDAYIAAEVTDEEDTYRKGQGYRTETRYENSKEAVKKLLNEAGFTTTANYSYFATDLAKIFGKVFEFNDNKNESTDKGLEHNLTILNQLVGDGDFLHSGSLESIIYSYTFAGNHDKCRALDGYSMDMDFVYADLTQKGNPYRERAYRILNGRKFDDILPKDDVDNYDYDRVNTLALAKCEAISSGMGKALQRVDFNQQQKDYVYGKMLEALKNISNGRYKGKTFETEGFGAKDYNIALDIVLNEMDYLEKNPNKRLSKEDRKKLKNETFERIIDPAMSRLLGQIKFLVALTGNPTLFAGDEYGSTGFETKTKNIFLQNRNIIHEEWADDDRTPEFKAFVGRFKNAVDYQFGLRARKELHPLNDGAPIALKEQNAHYKQDIYSDELNKCKNTYQKTNEGDTQVSALLRQSTDGAITISVFNTAGLNHKYDSYYDPPELTLNCIDLNVGRDGAVGLKGGLQSGMEFKNADPSDTKTYYVNDKNQITGPDGTSIKFKDSTLILYHVPNKAQQNQPSFKGRRVLYNPQYNFVSNPYKNINKTPEKTGEKLAILTK